MNIVCVLKKDVYSKKNPGIYNNEWVNKLYRGVKRNYTKPFNFFCLSNIETDVMTIPLEHDWKGWWSKVELFRPNLFQGPVLYLDLDIIILKNFEKLISNLDSKKFYMLEGQSKTNTPNSSIMYWNGDYSFIYKDFLKNIAEIQSKYNKGVKLGDQGFIYDKINNVSYINSIYPEFFSWKHPTHPKIIDTAAFCIFIGKEKPINNLELDLVKENWI
jgi:lipopolysaccharide biosynthesis glycosyltransferase